MEACLAVGIGRHLQHLGGCMLMGDEMPTAGKWKLKVGLRGALEGDEAQIDTGSGGGDGCNRCCLLILPSFFNSSWSLYVVRNGRGTLFSALHMWW